MDRWKMGGWMSGGWRYRQEDGQANGFMDGRVGKVDGWMDGKMDERVGRSVSGWVGIW